MFEMFRKGLGSWLAIVLLALLVLSFAIWGIGDPVSTLRTSDVGEIGGEKIPQVEMVRAFENEYSRIQQQPGAEGITPEMAIQFGLGRQAAARLFETKAYDVEARNLGLRATDENLFEYITSIPVFQDENGEFNRTFFNTYVSHQRISTQEFEGMLRAELVRNQLMQSLINNVEAPNVTADTLTKFASETRTSEVLSVPASAMTAIGEDTDEVLTAYYEANPDNYMSPEYRDVSYFEISASDLAATVEVSDEQARASYDEQILQYTQEEQRSFVQMLLDDEETADIAYTELQNGKSFEDVLSEKTGNNAEEASFELQTKEQFPSTYGTEAADLLFDLDENGYTQPVESGFGYYIFKVSSISAENVTNFEDVRDSIVQDIQMNDAIDRLFDVRNVVDDELAAGSPLEVIAAAINVPVKTVSAVSVEGFTPDGSVSTELPLIVEFLDQSFAREPGQELELIEGLANKFYMIDVTGIQDAQLRNLEEVKEEVRTDWAQNRRNELATELANQIISEFGGADEETAEGEAASEMASTGEGSKSLADFQNIMNSNLTLNQVSVGRGNENNDVSGEIHRSIFSQDVGGVEMIPAANGDGYVVVHVKSRTFNDDVESEAIEGTKTQIRTSIQNDLLAAYTVHLYSSLPVEINDANVQKALDLIVNPEDQVGF